MYEKVRVRAGYSRLPRTDRKAFEEENAFYEVVAHIDAQNGHQLIDLVEFLQKVFVPARNQDPKFLCRGLFVACAITQQTKSIIDIFSQYDRGDKAESIGFTKMMNCNLLKQVRGVVASITRQFASDKELMQLAVDPSTRKYFCQWFDCSSKALLSMPSFELQVRIEGLGK